MNQFTCKYITKINLHEKLNTLTYMMRLGATGRAAVRQARLLPQLRPDHRPLSGRGPAGR